MLGVTMLGVFFTPVLYVAVQKLKWDERRREKRSAGTEQSG